MLNINWVKTKGGCLDHSIYRVSVVLVAATAFLSACTSSSPEPEVSNVATYTLTTSFQGDGRALSATDLSVVSAEDASTVALLSLATAENASRQQWVFTKKDNGTYGISNRLIGVSHSIDVINDGVLDKIQLAATAMVSGQEWTVTPLENGYCVLTNNFTGSEIALDIRSDGDQSEPMLSAIGDFSGQHWKLTPVGNVALATDTILNLCVGSSAE